MMSSAVMPPLTNGHTNGKLENSLNGYKKNGYVNHECTESVVSAFFYINF